MEARLTLEIPNSQEGIRGVADNFDKFAAANAIPEAATWPVQVALDELLSNTVRCGHRERADDRLIEVRFHLLDGVLEVAVVDDAAPFNPLEVPEPDTTGTLEEREIGGLGVHIVKKLMDAVEYERKDGRNCLRFRKRIGA